MVEDIKFIKTDKEGTDLRVIQENYPNSIIDVNSKSEKNVYIGSERITDNYNLGVDDNSITNNVGGMTSGIYASELKGKSISEILDIILFASNNNLALKGVMVVDKIVNLTDSTLEEVYQGMVVSVIEDNSLYILLTDSNDEREWKRVGSDGSGIGKYSLPIMTEEMKAAALADPDSGFNSDSSYISIDDGSSLSGQTTSNNITAVNGSYLYIMMNTIRALQAEVAKLKNTFQYGIHSYNNEVTAKSSVLDQYDETLMDEPLWALDPYMMSEVFDTIDFKTELLPDNFTISSAIGGESIDASVPNQLTFKHGTGKFSDKANTLLNLTDSKLVTYLVTNSKHVYFNLHTKDDVNHNRRVDIASFIDGDYKKYGIMFVLSRKVGEHGKNYVYISVMNYDTNEKIVEGYLTDANKLSFVTGGDSTVYEVAYKYSIESIEFVEQTLYRMKFYTKYEDFSEEVIPSAPEDDYTYKAAHLTIRSVKNSAMMERIKEQLHENELIWNEDKKELNIKSNNKIYKIGIVGSNDNNTNTEETMTAKELIEKLTQMGIIVNAQFDSDNNIINVDDLKLNDISEFSLVNSDTEKKYTFTVDPHGKLIGRDESMKTIEVDLAKIFEGETYDEKVKAMNDFLDIVDDNNASQEYGWIRGFIPVYLNALKGKNKWAPNGTSSAGAGDYGLLSDRLRISSFYAPLKTDVVHGCSHSFIELENTSDVDIPLDGIYLHFYIPAIDGVEDSNIVHHLALDGVIKSGSTYLIRGAQHAEMDDESTFIKVDSYDKEWYYKKKDDKGNVIDYGLVSFEQDIVATTTGDNGGAVEDTVNNKVHGAYKFCLTYGLPDLDKDVKLIAKNISDKLYITIDGQIVDSNYNSSTKMEFKKSDFPNIIKNRRYIDGCGFSSFSGFANAGTYDDERKKGDQVLCKGIWFCGGVTITENTMFRNMFALDPAKQAYNGWNMKDGSRTRYNKATDLQVVSLDKEYIGFPNSEEIVPISRYTPKASYENRNVMTDKSQLDREKPNMVTCSFGIDVYKTRCFNWISCGAFDEYLWVRKQGDTAWKSFASYTKTSTQIEQKSGDIVRKEFSPSVNNAVYARITSRFPGNNVLFTSHKVIIDLTPLAESDAPVVYEYVVGRADKNGNPDSNHTNDIYTFTLYPSSYEGRTYQITDQQGFHWIEYQVWAATAEKLNKVIEKECNDINGDVAISRKVFPILINTGDMTQSGARINEWLDYYNGGKCIFNHIEQMNCVGNNDLCNLDPTILGTGNDPGKSNAKFFHYFYCYEVPNDDSLIVKAHEVTVKTDASETKIYIPEDRYIPSVYYFETRGVMYIVANSEITKTTCEKWFGLYGDVVNNNTQSINLYTGIEIRADGNYNNKCQNEDKIFHPIYETIYSWLNNNATVGGNKKIVFVCHEIPFTVITRASLSNSNANTMSYTRNYPNGSGSLLGSHMNQLDYNENRGTYWISRLLEQFGCKLCIGGHKHTYALSYPIKENYQWKNSGNEYNSLTNPKPMSATLEDECGANPVNEVSWVLKANYNSDGNPYNIGTNLSDSGDISISSTKLPYIPNDLYGRIGKNKFEENGNTDYYRCCTPVSTTDNSKYDGFVNYSMCQATGYKLKSNKELPSAYQVFSKLIPMTTYVDGSDKPNENQLYPMFSVLEYKHDRNGDINAINVKLCRVAGIFKKDGKDSFTQTSYGTNAPTIHYLIEVNSDNVETIKSALNKEINQSEYMYGEWVSEGSYFSPELEGNNKYLYIQY